jgi:DnaJ family protein A protein 2
MIQTQVRSSRSWVQRTSHGYYFIPSSSLMWHLLSYETLSDPELRRMYDIGGMDSLHGPGPGMGGMDAADLFAQFFESSGGGMPFGFDFGAGPSRRRRGTGEDTVIPHAVTLDELYNGKTLKLNMEKQAVCGICKG